MNEKIKNYRNKVDKRLIARQRIFFIIIPILLTITIINIITGKLGPILALIGFTLATILGIILSRMFKIFWHQEKGKVISQLDAVGIIFLVLYILVELGRNWFFGHWLSGAELTAFGLVIITGLLLGRFLGTLIKIKKILSESTN